MKDKVVIISGGTEGLGRGIVLKLLEEGFKIVTFSRKKKKVCKLKEELTKKYKEENFLVLKGDISKENQVKQILEETIKKFNKIDILINNAGCGFFTECDNVDLKEFKKLIETNLIGVASLTKSVVPFMKKQKQGLIINISSRSGKEGYALGEFYVATKFAIMGYSQSIRKELKNYNIKVSTVCPGMIKTSFFTKEELEKRERAQGKLSFLEIDDITPIISLICNQSESSDIQDILIMPN